MKALKIVIKSLFWIMCIASVGMAYRTGELSWIIASFACCCVFLRNSMCNMMIRMEEMLSKGQYTTKTR